MKTTYALKWFQRYNDQLVGSYMGSFTYRAGRWHRVEGAIALCENGFHVVSPRSPDVVAAHMNGWNAELWLVKVRGDQAPPCAFNRKSAHREMRPVRRVWQRNFGNAFGVSAARTVNRKLRALGIDLRIKGAR